MKKKLLSVILAACMVMSFSGCWVMGNDNESSDNEETTTTSVSFEDLDSLEVKYSTQATENNGKCNVSITAVVKTNVVFSKYSVDVSIDGKVYTTIAKNDSVKEINVALDKGTHKITFSRNDDPFVYVDITETITSDTQIKYYLKRHKDKIDVDNKDKE